MNYSTLYQRSIADRDGFWHEQAARIDWRRRFDQVCDHSNPPFARWFVGGLTNLCHNAVDRHVAHRADQPALIHVAPGLGTERSLSYGQLFVEVQRMAAVLQGLGVVKGDRVLIYMPMMLEAVIAMLATVRLGAIHSVVFSGFASQVLANRIDDAAPRVIITADAGSRGGQLMPCKPVLDEALSLANRLVQHVVVVNRGLWPITMNAPQDVDYAEARNEMMDAIVPCEWVESNHPSYTLYTSGTTGQPKAVQRDTGGYAVALATSMDQIYDGQAGESFFCTIDIAWAGGHGYVVYGPLIAGMASIVHEGLPTQPDAAIWWSLVEKHQVSVMLSVPSAIRELRQHDPECLQRHDLSSLKHLFLAGEAPDEPTSRWISAAIGKPVVDQYWQTETGWPVLAVARGVQADQALKPGSQGVPMVGYQVKLMNESTGQELTEPGQRGVLAIEGPLPPGCLQTVWRNNLRFTQAYWSSFPGRKTYNTFDWATRDEDGYYFILGRMDDVINVAGLRLSTREIEGALASHPGVAEAAVVGVSDDLHGQVPHAFVVPSDPLHITQQSDRIALAAELTQTVDRALGALARPASIHFVLALPRTRSGKLLRRVIQAVCEGRDAGDVSTMDNPAVLRQLQQAVKGEA
ncbi:propionate--CoA ligase [Aquabacterium sp.]|uniref:propionate--CoA ligase n=1 Tax=Aquabacterium sp. TaxID=1872578 RepID=UPI0024885FAC|nr:propionate--CoA ligase [Aquabacterium sp.]MDI1260524.1 propionate--CoA ligase [Aquabacterium sp.]